MLIGIVFTSCVPVDKLVYTQKQKKDEHKDEYINIRTQKTIQPFDNLYVKVNSIDEKTQRVFDGNSAGSLGANIDLISYTVSQTGYINFPFVGEIFVKDMTLLNAQKTIEAEVGEYLNNISISVKFINNMVSIVGEVHRPGEYKFYKDQITIFQALSLAGDISDYGNKKEITLVREANNVISYYYLDLTDKRVVESPYYYIIPNDVIIVKPIRQKFRNLSLVNIPILLTTVTTAVTLYLLFYNAR